MYIHSDLHTTLRMRTLELEMIHLYVYAQGVYTPLVSVYSFRYCTVNRLAYYSAHAYIGTGDDTLICVRTGVYTLLAYV